MTERHNQCAEILYRIYKDWDVTKLPRSIRMKLWAVFVNRVKAAAHQSVNLRHFVYKLTDMLEIHTLSDPTLLDLLTNDDECLSLLREEAKLIVLMVRQKLHDEKEGRQHAKT